MRIELRAPVVLSPLAPMLWHLPAPNRRTGKWMRTLQDALERGANSWSTLCALEGQLYAYDGPVRARKLCAVCRQRGPREHVLPGEGPLPVPSSCGLCRRPIDLDDAGVLVVCDKEAGFAWHALCHAIAVAPPPAGPWTPEELQALYLRYLRRGLPLVELVGPLWRAKGYATAAAGESSVRQAWRRHGWPVRQRGETMRLRRSREGPRLLPSRKLSEQIARELHPLHWEQWRSVNSIAKEYSPQIGLTASALCSQLCYTWKLLDLPRHDRIEMTVRASTRHGLKRRQGSSSAVYKRFRAGEKGEQYDKPCEGTTARGGACRARAMLGSRFCQSHQPDRREAIVDHLATMRTLSPRHRAENLTTVVEVQELLAAYWDWAHSWKPLAALSGYSNTQLRRWLIAPPETRMLRSTASRLRRALLEVTPIQARAPELELEAAA